MSYSPRYGEEARTDLVSDIGSRIMAKLGTRHKSVICDMTGISDKRMSRLCAGNTSHGPDAHELRIIARALGVSASWLAWGTP